MITEIRLAKVATYGDSPQEMRGLSQFNYIYGPNAAGKTTLSNLIASPSEDHFLNCAITWKDGIPLQALVYNRDFVAKNFNSSSELKGIFTLGEEDAAIAKAIRDAKQKRDEAEERVVRLTATLVGVDGEGGKQGELRHLRVELRGKCWEQKKKYDSQFQMAFSAYGVRADSEKFLERVLAEDASNTATLDSLEALLRRAETVFEKTPTAEPRITSLITGVLLEYERSEILRKHVVGRSDVDIAAMIKKLGNSDWVKAGRTHLHANDGFCPFCQQKAPDSLAQSLEDYFDETFETDTQAIASLRTNYEAEANRAKQAIEKLKLSSPNFLDTKRVAHAEDLFEAQILVNLGRIDDKVREPSASVALESLEPVLNELKAAVAEANAKIDEHNNMVADLGNQRKQLIAQVWKYIVSSELKTDIAEYKSKSDGVSKAIASLKRQIEDAEKEVVAKESEIRALEKTTTSTQPAIDAINATLRSFNFQSFKIQPASDHTYKLIRADGSDARDTLSEGEKTFVTFLYFYHLLKGSNTQSGITTDRIVVFDDPVSSLDSDVLFIVSTLIREVISGVRDGTSLIKQVFVLTHNVYFHKEVTYANNRGDKTSLKEETFWTVRRKGAQSEVVRHEGNPIKTSYELLWHDVRKPVGVEMTIQNTLRRIIEAYFKILGGIDKDKLLSKVSGPERIACAALLSWVNDGSHGAHDDVFVAADDTGVDAHLKAFHRIFLCSDHESHYQMMMGDAYVPLDDAPEMLEAAAGAVQVIEFEPA
jgi:wobble nucleotide-excising tRNase